MEKLTNILFIDIETVSVVPDFQSLSPAMQELWAKKSQFFRNEDGTKITPEETFNDRAGIFAEFGSIVCIGIGCLVPKGDQWTLLLKALSSRNEKQLLEQFCDSLSKFSEKFSDLLFCGHNIREFDMPYISRRLLLNGIPLPRCMSYMGKESWQVPYLDTLKMWSFGDREHYTSLALLAELFNLPSPKDEIDGSMVSQVFWEGEAKDQKKDALNKISDYCLSDVETTARIFLRLKGIDDLNPTVSRVPND
jgi:DNA polymerase elongation subunit (family B)